MKDVIVVKLGGSLLDQPDARARALQAIATAWSAGQQIVLVHGGGKNIDTALVALGIPKRTHHGLRITDSVTLQVVVSTLAGAVNQSVVTGLQGEGVQAIGISGARARILSANFHPAIDGVELGFVGEVVKANAEPLFEALSQGFLPVVAPLGFDASGTTLNVNADTAAAAVAVALGARRLVFLTDVEGLLDQQGNLVPRLAAGQVSELVETGVVHGGMQPKLKACVVAIEQGVGDVVIAGPSTHVSSLLQGSGGTHLVAA